MQTIDVQNDIQQVKYQDAAPSNSQKHKAVKEPDGKCSSFIDIVKKMLVEEADVVLQDGADTDGAESVEQSSLKKDGIQNARRAYSKGTAERKNNEESVFHACLDTHGQKLGDAYTDVQGVSPSKGGVKTSLKTLQEEHTKKPLYAQAVQRELEAEYEGLSVLLDKEVVQGKKQKSRAVQDGCMPEAVQKTLHDIRLLDKKAADGAQSLADDAQKRKVHMHRRPHHPVFTVIDNRTVPADQGVLNSSVHEAGAAVRVTEVPTVDMALDFRSTTTGFASAQQSVQAGQDNGTQPFASLVAQQVQDMAGDFVQAGRIILQDNNAGLIRLQMQPAHLGNVRINLELTGNKKIIGKIITGSKETYEAFKESIEKLTQAFEQGGFASAQFDVGWSDEGGSKQFDGKNDQFNELFTRNNQLEVMQHIGYADTETVYAFTQDQAVNVFA